LLRVIATEIHKPRRNKFPTRKVEASAPNAIWSCDLLDMSSDSPAQNDGYRYILVCVDVYSRFVSVAALKSKTETEVLSAFKDLFTLRGVVPERLWVDQGKEFVNTKMTTFLAQHNSQIYHTFGPHKSAIAERFNRTLRTGMQAIMSSQNTLTWNSAAVLGNVVKTYNNRIHTTTKRRPIDLYEGRAASSSSASTAAAAATAPEKKKAKPKFSVGDIVRVSRTKGIFEKEADHNWSRELFTVARVRDTDPYTFYLTDYNKQPVQGAFYTEELQKSKQDPDLHLVDKIIRTDKKKKKAFVSWVGYPPSFNSWIDL
jgi:hypothetical protein